LARYHDVDYKNNGAEKLCELLNLNYNDIFPICYDLSRLVKKTSGKMEYKEPEKKLKRSEIIALALE
jgi:hypothetical protein